MPKHINALSLQHNQVRFFAKLANFTTHQSGISWLRDAYQNQSSRFLRTRKSRCCNRSPILPKLLKPVGRFNPLFLYVLHKSCSLVSQQGSYNLLSTFFDFGTQWGIISKKWPQRVLQDCTRGPLNRTKRRYKKNYNRVCVQIFIGMRVDTEWFKITFYLFKYQKNRSWLDKLFSERNSFVNRQRL